MGCVISKGKVTESDMKLSSGNSCGFSGEIQKGGSGPSIYDSGELRMTPVRASSRKVPQVGSIIGRAGIASLERAVSVLDTLGSSMSNFNATSGFDSGITSRGNKVAILAFEVANTIAKGANLLRSISEENMQFFKEEVLKSEGIRELVSVDDKEFMIIAAADKREELNVFSAEIIRFGNLCKDPVWHNLGRYFDRLGSEPTHQEQHKEEVEMTMQELINLCQNTSELYHELHALDRFEQDYQRKLQEEEGVPTARRENLMILHSELKSQRKTVKTLRKKSLWSRNLEEIVEKLVDISAYMHKAILETFGITDNNMVEQGAVRYQRLGFYGLALHYANIINQIDNIVSRPLTLPPNTRDTLYQGLPPTVKSALRSSLQSFDSKEEYTVAQIKAEMQKTLRWIVPLAENTIRAHQGFGWVGEWANICSEMNKKTAPQCSIARIQTLYHADKKRTEEIILELVVWLHYLVIQVKNTGYGFKAMKPLRSRSKKGALLLEAKKEDSPASNGSCSIVFELSEEDRDMLNRVDSTKMVLGRSKSHDLATVKDKKRERNARGLSRSFGNSPSEEFNTSLELHLQRTRALDRLDGLDGYF